MKTFRQAIAIMLSILLVASLAVVGASAEQLTGDYGPIVLDATEYSEAAEWYCWTWADGSSGHWVIGHGTSAADITFDRVESNVIFACFPWGNGTPSSSWDYKIAQTADLIVSGSKFTVSSVSSGAVYGSWSGNIPYYHEATSEAAASEAAASEVFAGYGPIVIDDSGVSAGDVDWRALTWADGESAHWVFAHSTADADITFDKLEENVIFACFESGSPVDDNWTGLIAQTSTKVVQGAAFIILSLNTSNGVINGRWSGTAPAIYETVYPSEAAASETTPSEAATSEASADGTVTLDASAGPSNVEWYCWTWNSGLEGKWAIGQSTDDYVRVRY